MTILAPDTEELILPLGARGPLEPLAPGVSLVPGDPNDEYAVRLAIYIRRVVEWALRNTACIISHLSGAALHGLPADCAPLVTIHAIRPGAGGNRHTRRVWRHAARLTHDDVLRRGPLRITSLSRTLVDVARTEETWRAVAMADNALGRKLIDPAGLAAALARIAGQPGSAVARDALVLADGRAESVGESRTRVTMICGGLPDPHAQVEVFTADGFVIGRADFGYPEYGVLIEFDGAVKYGKLLRPGQSVADVKDAEEQRERALRRVGFVVVRIVWADLDDPEALVRRIREALSVGRGRAAAGQVTRGWRARPPLRLDAMR